MVLGQLANLYANKENEKLINTDLDKGLISIDEKNSPLIKVFKTIESKTDFSFFYDKKVVNESKLITIKKKNASLEHILDHISVQTGLSFKIINDVISVNLSLPINEDQSTIQQPKKVFGKVISQSDGEPLPGVTIQLKGVAVGTTSDFDGNYDLNVPNQQAVLVFSYLGFKTHEEVVGDRLQINVSLEEDTQQLEEVVVTALGIKREEKSLGYAVQKVSGENLQAVKGVDVATSMTGKVAGLWIQNSTEFNKAPDIRLRGGSSNPLLVIDGIPYGNMSLNEVASDDIASMDVLKGATASALYGARGSGGAIIISTISGGDGLSINSNSMFFAGYLALPKVQSSYSAGLGGTYSATDYVWGQKLDVGNMAEQWNPETKQLENMPLTSRGKNNFNDFLEPGFINNNNISFSRSGDLGYIRTSLTHIYNEGQYPNLKLNKLNANVSGKLKLGDNFELQSSLGYNRSTSPQTTGSGYGDQGYMYQILLWTGPEYDLSKYRDYWIRPNIEQNWHYKAWYDNPYFIAYEKLRGEETNMVNVNLTPELKLFDGAKLTGRIGYDFYSNEYTRRNPPSVNSTRLWDSKGLYNQDERRGYSLNTDLLFNYGKRNLGIEGFDLDLTLGGSMYQYEEQSLFASTRNGIIVPGIYSLNNSVERPDVATFRRKKQVNSVLGLLSLGYANSIFVDVTGRNDWSSTLPSTSRSYFYPSVASSVLLSEFIGKTDWLDLWKVRGSWTVSKQDLGVYDTNVNYNVNQGAWEDYNTATYPTTIKGIDVDPETSRTWEIGTAAYLLKNRVMLDVAYYNIYNYNRQISSPIPSSSGFTSTLINTDETRERKGVEVTLNAGIIKNDDFTWDASVNWSKTHSYYKDLDPIYSPDNLWVKPGGRVDNYTITDWQRDPQGNVIHNSGGRPIRGDYSSFFDYSDPDFIWGFTNTFTYKNFDFHLSFDGRVGGVLYNYTAYKMWDTGSHPDSDNEWRYDEVVNGNISYIGDGVQVVSGEATYDQYGQITSDNRVYAPNNTPISYETYARRFADGKFGATDPTFVKLREVAIGYTFPKDFSNKIGMNRATVSLTAQNVFLWTKEFKFADPDFNSDSQLSSPSQRFVGLNVKLHTAAKNQK
ncbi:SusC/RagA family TonB-linked outer membrane protein [Arenibacter certesii]|uniref:SusC/RagA family TonB-linked outer membrane protein n=2 Tax=Arenibacter certesii TaxID=228955 RepID=A0A918MPX8_9FLAO|nr:SusC/RagA family TonB-linked outer membrane protein [Arenibacter certesii]